MEIIEMTVGVPWWPGLLAGVLLGMVFGQRGHWHLAAQGLAWTLLLTLLAQGLFIQFVPLSTLLVADISSGLLLTSWALACLPVVFAVGWWIYHRDPRR